MIGVTDNWIVAQLTTPTFFSVAHNLPIGGDVDFWIVQFVDSMAIDLQLIVNNTQLSFNPDSISPGTIYKLVAYGIQNGLVEGMFWSDGYIYDDQQASISFTSGSSAAPSGEAKTFSGSCRLNTNSPAIRTLVATALDADPPYLLAQTESDVNGSYTLEWQGYSGQMLVTAMQDYGVVFEPGATVGAADRIHPSSPNGYVYDVAQIGTLGTEEPAWPTEEGDTVTSGTVQLVAVRYYQPLAHGPFYV